MLDMDTWDQPKSVNSMLIPPQTSSAKYANIWLHLKSLSWAVSCIVGRIFLRIGSALLNGKVRESISVIAYAKTPFRVSFKRGMI